MPGKKKPANGIDVTIKSLGQAKIPTALPHWHFIRDDEPLPFILTEEETDEIEPGKTLSLSVEKAGPRELLYFDSSKTKCAIVTCGGLCPGINDVIRAIVMTAHHNYHVASVLGVRFGLQGFIPSFGHDVVELTPKKVSEIHQFGGTILGSSRGHQPPDEIVDALERMNINCLFMIGGDGTMRAAAKVVEEIAKRNLRISIIGIPKTIDNDINFVSQSFGFDTAVEKATEAIQSAHTEAVGVNNGIGMVKLMGRESGFIAAQATLALKEVNFVLVPEVPFELQGDGGLLMALERRLRSRNHAVLVVAEGAGQNLCDVSGQHDASGNPVLGDICTTLRSSIAKHFKEKGMDTTLKFIDPSYIIRSVPANANDRVYCGLLGQHAVHAAMAGKTGMVISMIRGNYVHLPLSLVVGERRRLNVRSDYWRAVMESTGQLMYMNHCRTDAS